MVRLKRGAFGEKTVYSADPVEVAVRFEKAGARRLHVVDLDGAKTGEPVHVDVIRKIAQSVRIPLEVGGGVRKLRTAEIYADIPNVDRLILGTAAAEKPKVLRQILALLGDRRVVLSVDVKSGKVATRGWMAETESDPIPFGRSLHESGIRMAVFTDIRKDGMMTGPNLKSASQFSRKTGLQVIVSGGVSSLDDIREVAREKNPLIIGVIVGRAIYEGAVDLSEAVEAAS